MKHLISLSLKYVRRQKLRSTLTFLCITLSVFILNTFSAYFSSIRHTMINTEIYNEGAWEVNLTKLINDCEDPDKAFDILQNHVVIEEFYYRNMNPIGLNTSFDENGVLAWFDVGINGEHSIRVNDLWDDVQAGDFWVAYAPALFEGQTLDDMQVPECPAGMAENAAYVPYWIEDLGYSIGDTLTLTITPSTGGLDMDSPQVQQVRDYVESHNRDSSTYYEVQDMPEDFLSVQPREDQNSFIGTSMLDCLLQFYTFEEINFADVQTGNPYTCTITIAGFHENGYNAPDLDEEPVGEKRSLSLDLFSNDAVNFMELVESNPDFPFFNIWQETEAAAVLTDNMEFEDALMLFLKDIGFPETKYYDYFSVNSINFHSTLLGLKCKSAVMIGNLAPLLAVLLVMILFAWLIARFVIDNAFEISVQERSAQFAVLRIMGASRSQLVALIFTEAIFYCITAVPIGAIAAFLSCKGVMEGLHNMGLPNFVFMVDPIVTVIGIILSIIAIFTSAYTSAMWAARKLSPLETLRYGKPKRKASYLNRPPKARLDRKAGSFVLHYTLKNIFRTKSRFLISTIAMTLGIAMFLFCTLSSSCIRRLNEYNRNQEGSFDFYLYSMELTSELLKEAETSFAQSDCFSEYQLQCFTGFTGDEDDTQVITSMLPNDLNDETYICIQLVHRSMYEKYIETLTGMNYESFIATGSALVYSDPCGNDPEYEDGMPVRIYEDHYQSWKDFEFSKMPVISNDFGTTIPISGTICFEYPAASIGGTTVLYPAELAITTLDDGMLDRALPFLNLTVSGHEQYEDAKEIVQAFASAYCDDYYEDNYINNTGMAMYVEALFRAVSAFLLSVWLVGVLSMVNSINTSVLNRQRELVMLRAVGMTKQQLLGSVLLESILFSAYATIFGILLGVVSYIGGMNFLLVDANLFVNAPAPIVLTVILTLVINLIIALLAALPGVEMLSRRLKA